MSVMTVMYIGLCFSIAEMSPALPHAGGAYSFARTAMGPWGGYITGRNLELVPGRRIVQSWRTTKFTDDDPDSKIAVALHPVPGGTHLTLRHSKVPGGHAGYEQGGWQTHYFAPMKKYFAKQADRLARKYAGTKKPRPKVKAAGRTKVATGRAKAAGRKPARSLVARPRKTRRPARRR